MSIYVVTHKSFNTNFYDNSDFYKPLLVGADVGNTAEDYYLKDNTGVNISKKNKSFCELTGIFWVWKNRKDDIVGIDHYRRYFVDNDNKAISENNVRSILNEYDIILPKREKYIFQGYTAAQYFGICHDPLVWTLCRDIIKEKYPEYIKDFDWFSKQKTGYCYNMFISSSTIINKYNEWLFSILSMLENNINLDNYDSYNQRMFGFLSERLLNVWVHHKKLKVKECPIYINIKVSKRARIKSWLKQKRLEYKTKKV